MSVSYESKYRKYVLNLHIAQILLISDISPGISKRKENKIQKENNFVENIFFSFCLALPSGNETKITFRNVSHLAERMNFGLVTIRLYR